MFVSEQFDQVSPKYDHSAEKSWNLRWKGGLIRRGGGEKERERKKFRKEREKERLRKTTERKESSEK